MAVTENFTRIQSYTVQHDNIFVSDNITKERNKFRI